MFFYRKMLFKCRKDAATPIFVRLRVRVRITTIYVKIETIN